jgi:hypothetical protein
LDADAARGHDVSEMTKNERARQNEDAEGRTQKTHKGLQATITRKTNQHICIKNRTWHNCDSGEGEFIPVDLGVVVAPPARFLAPVLGLRGRVR